MGSSCNNAITISMVSLLDVLECHELMGVYSDGDEALTWVRNAVVAKRAVHIWPMHPPLARIAIAALPFRRLIRFSEREGQYVAHWNSSCMPMANMEKFNVRAVRRVPFLFGLLGWYGRGP